VRPREPFTYFVDRCLGREAVPNALRAALKEGEQLRCFDELYSQNTLDETWIPEIGANGWIILTQDKAIQRRPNEVRALLVASTAVFIFAGANATGQRIGLGLTIALPGIRTATRRFQVPVLGRVTLSGEVSVAWVEGEKLETPKYVKIRKSGHESG
jgi:hypothetical protein